MKKWVTVVVAVAISTCAFAADGWMTDFEKVKAKAKADNKHILIDFSGSDWCGWCIKLDEEVFSKKPFKEYAKENLVLMLADFPRDKSKLSEDIQKQNDQMMKEFSVRGFPTVFILNPEGEKVAQMGYEAGGSEAYVELIKKLIAGAK